MKRRDLLRSLAVAPVLLSPPARPLGSPRSPNYGIPSPALAAFIESHAAPWRRPGSPGAAVAVLSDGDLVFSRTWGLAELETGKPFASDSRMHICSITKQFTTALLFLLEEERKVDLDADIHDYLPELPDFGAPVRVRNLSSNTSGVRDHEILPAIANGTATGVLTEEYTRRLINRQRSLMFEPGARVSYSNTNFVLIGWLVMRIEGKPLGEVLARRIFEPLGMRNTQFLENTQPQPAGSVVGYVRRDGGYHAPRVAVAEAGAGGIWSTLDDLVIWERNILSNRLGRGDLFDRMGRPESLSDGQLSWYAHGLGTGRVRGVFWKGHAGGLSGMQLNRVFIPDRRLSVIVAKNGPDGPDPERLCLDIAAELLPLPTAAPKRATLQTESWRGLAGVYQYGAGAYTVRLNFVEDRVELDSLRSVTRLTHERHAVASSEDGKIQLRDTGGGSVEVKLEREPWIRLQRVEPVPADESDLDVYVGTYESQELESAYTVARADKDLRLAIRGPLGSIDDVPIERIARDVFVVGGQQTRRAGATITFQRDGSQRPLSLAVSTQRAEGSVFVIQA